MGDVKRRRTRAEPTDDWEQLELLCRWPEQLAYEEIRTAVLFGVPFEAASRGGAHRGTTAIASISTRKSGFANPATKAAVIAGGFGVATHAR